MTTNSTDTERARELYLDLLIKVLINSIYRDPPTRSVFSQPGSGSNFFNAAVRAHGSDWPSQAHSMSGERRLTNVRDLAQRVLDEQVPGDFAELGVWRGGCCILMRAVLAVNGVTSRKIYVCDSFAGLPPPNPQRFPEDEGVDLNLRNELAVSADQVRENFSRYGLLDDQVVFVEGFFQDTIPHLDTGPFALIRLDGDMYESTYIGLESLYPQVSANGFIIIDDYGALSACRAAVSDYRNRFKITAPIHRIDWSGVWWQKVS